MTVTGPATGTALLTAVEVMDRLRSPGGCPWDAQQTHASLAPYAIEEAYEVAEAAESADASALADELGDLLLQVLFHARVASESEGGFDIDDVARNLVAKLRRRHPHVFADQAQLSAAEVNQQWDAIKAQEPGRAHPLDGIPVSLPALARAQKVVRRLNRAESALERPGDSPAPGEAAIPAVPQPVSGANDGANSGPLDTTQSSTPTSHRVGEQLLAIVRQAEEQAVDAEAALRAAVRQIEDDSRRRG
ncbi:MAG: MazG family protein [Beutenbergiaceae bacterium]